MRPLGTYPIAKRKREYSEGQVREAIARLKKYPRTKSIRHKINVVNGALGKLLASKNRTPIASENRRPKPDPRGQLRLQKGKPLPAIKVIPPAGLQKHAGK